MTNTALGIRRRYLEYSGGLTSITRVALLSWLSVSPYLFFFFSVVPPHTPLQSLLEMHFPLVLLFLLKVVIKISGFTNHVYPYYTSTIRKFWFTYFSYVSPGATWMQLWRRYDFMTNPSYGNHANGRKKSVVQQIHAIRLMCCNPLWTRGLSLSDILTSAHNRTLSVITWSGPVSSGGLSHAALSGNLEASIPLWTNNETAFSPLRHGDCEHVFAIQWVS